MPRTGLMHVHSTLSYDGELTLEEIAHLAKRRGYDFVAVTEHSETFDEAAMRRLVDECARLSTSHFLVIPGIEFACQKDLHILGVGIERFAVLPDAVGTARFIKDQGGLVIVAHPSRCHYQISPGLEREIDGIEVWNSRYDAPFVPNDRSIILWRSLKRRNGDLVPFGGQDFHQKRGRVHVTTTIDGDKLDRNAVLAALRAGRFVISGVPFKISPATLEGGNLVTIGLCRRAYVGARGVGRLARNRLRALRRARPGSGRAPRQVNRLMPDVTHVNTALEKATRWLLHSGISITDRDQDEYGAVYSYYDSSARRYELIYSEATGYLISLVKYLTSLRQDAGMKEFAAASGDWLVAAARKHGGAISIGHRDGHEIREAYPFDNGVCCRGLIDLYDLTGERKYLECAEAVAEWILRDALMEDGSVRPVLDLRTGRFLEDRTFWFKVSGSFQAKIAMPLFRLGELTGREIFRDAALRICGWAMREQCSDGRFPVNKRSRFVSLHTHCYTIEALLYAYAVEKSGPLLMAATQGVDWIRRVQRADGSAWLWHGGSLTNSKASYTAAQVVRILSLMNMLNHDERLMETATNAARFMLSMRAGDGDPRIHGGFREGDNRSYSVRIRRGHHVLSWGTMFAIQALHLLQERRIGDFDRCVRHLF